MEELQKKYGKFLSDKERKLEECAMLRRPGNYAKGIYLSKNETKKNMCVYQEKVIPRSLFKLSTEYFDGNAKESDRVKALAPKIFKDILVFTDTKKNKVAKRIAAADSILKTGGREEKIRDEIFCQLIKQTSACPKANANYRGWLLLYLCARSFPAYDVKPFLLSHAARFAPDCMPTKENIPDLNTVEGICVNLFFLLTNTSCYKYKIRHVKDKDVKAVEEKGDISYLYPRIPWEEYEKPRGLPPNPATKLARPSQLLLRSNTNGALEENEGKLPISANTKNLTVDTTVRSSAPLPDDADKQSVPQSPEPPGPPGIVVSPPSSNPPPPPPDGTMDTDEEGDDLTPAPPPPGPPGSPPSSIRGSDPIGPPPRLESEVIGPPTPGPPTPSTPGPPPFKPPKSQHPSSTKMERLQLKVSSPFSGMDEKVTSLSSPPGPPSASPPSSLPGTPGPPALPERARVSSVAYDEKKAKLPPPPPNQAKTREGKNNLDVKKPDEEGVYSKTQSFLPAQSVAMQPSELDESIARLAIISDSKVSNRRASVESQESAEEVAQFSTGDENKNAGGVSGILLPPSLEKLEKNETEDKKLTKKREEDRSKIQKSRRAKVFRELELKVYNATAKVEDADAHCEELNNLLSWALAEE